MTPRGSRPSSNGSWRRFAAGSAKRRSSWYARLSKEPDGSYNVAHAHAPVYYVHAMGDFQRRAAEDPYDIEVQRRLEEAIRQQNVNNSLEQAMEYAPETFGRVFMLYINCEINGHKVKAFVDSGAQMTISMQAAACPARWPACFHGTLTLRAARLNREISRPVSSSFAEKCGLSWYLDTRYTGVAKGVGSARILGRIHMSPIKIGNLFLPCSFTVLEEQSVDLLLGLDMLRRHQAIIDLKANVLRIGEVETPFLGEADLPESARERPEDLAEAEHLANSAAKRARDTAANLASSSGQAAAAGSNSGAPGSSAVTAGSGPSIAAAAPAAAKPSPAPQAAPAFPEEVVQSLMALGVSREQAVAALQAAGGNPDLAAGLLF